MSELTWRLDDLSSDTHSTNTNSTQYRKRIGDYSTISQMTTNSAHKKAKRSALQVIQQERGVYSYYYLLSSSLIQVLKIFQIFLLIQSSALGSSQIWNDVFVFIIWAACIILPSCWRVIYYHETTSCINSSNQAELNIVLVLHQIWSLRTWASLTMYRNFPPFLNDRLNNWHFSLC